MLVSYNWLNKYFDGKLPKPADVAEAFTFHAWEIDDVTEVGDDTVLDVKVLPDKSMWALSHRGIAKDISVILNLSLANDGFNDQITLEKTSQIDISLESNNCRRFAAAKISGVKVGPSPEWLKKSLESIGQRSINNIVDASNFVMFDLGQPSHAFDAKSVGEQGFKVRNAKAGEKLTGLDGVEYTFTEEDTVIARGDTDEILSIAGLKGGQHSGIGDNTTEVIVEVANWNPVSTRKTGRRLKLRTDASARYENGIVPEVIPFALDALVKLIIEVAGGEVSGYSEVIKTETATKTVSVSLSKINSVLGVSLSNEEVTEIINRFGWKFETASEIFTIHSPFERTDLVIPEDIIEEIGRIYGYDHVKAVVPKTVALPEINQRFYYLETLRDALIAIGFSEIYTSSFRKLDEVKLANAFASDKGYLRSSLLENMKEALVKNAPNADLLGINQIRLFEIGNVFTSEGESLKISLGVTSPSGYKAKTDDPVLNEALEIARKVFNAPVETKSEGGVVEIDLSHLINQMPVVTSYQQPVFAKDIAYRPFSNYPAIARDIAMWVVAGDSEEEINSLLKEKAGPLCIRITQFDRFLKEGRVSLAFRLVFQSYEKTLTDVEVNEIMDKVYETVKTKGWEVR